MWRTNGFLLLETLVLIGVLTVIIPTMLSPIMKIASLTQRIQHDALQGYEIAHMRQLITDDVRATASISQTGDRLILEHADRTVTYIVEPNGFKRRQLKDGKSSTVILDKITPVSMFFSELVVPSLIEVTLNDTVFRVHHR